MDPTAPKEEPPHLLIPTAQSWASLTGKHGSSAHLLRPLIGRHHCFSAGSVVSQVPSGAFWFCSGWELVQYYCVTIQTGHWIAPLLQINASESSAASESRGASSVYERSFVFPLSEVPQTTAATCWACYEKISLWSNLCLHLWAVGDWENQGFLGPRFLRRTQPRAVWWWAGQERLRGGSEEHPSCGLSSRGEGEKIEQLGELIALLKDPGERKKQQRGSTERQNLGCPTQPPQQGHLLRRGELGCGRPFWWTGASSSCDSCLASTPHVASLPPGVPGVADVFPVAQPRSRQPETLALLQGCWSSAPTRFISVERSNDPPTDLDHR